MFFGYPSPARTDSSQVVRVRGSPGAGFVNLVRRGLTRVKRLRDVATTDDLVNRKFHRLGLDELWSTDITDTCHQKRQDLLLSGSGRIQPQDHRMGD